MSEKRFEIWKINSKKNGVKDNQENAYYSLEEFLDWLNEKELYSSRESICDLLNQLNDKNEQLKEENERLKLVVSKLFFLLGLCNEVLDIRDYIFYKECLKDESDL